MASQVICYMNIIILDNDVFDRLAVAGAVLQTSLYLNYYIYEAELNRLLLATSKL